MRIVPQCITFEPAIAAGTLADLFIQMQSWPIHRRQPSLYVPCGSMPLSSHSAPYCPNYPNELYYFRHIQLRYYSNTPNNLRINSKSSALYCERWRCYVFGLEV